MIEETPKTDFYLKLSSEAEVPTVLSAFYKQDTTSEFDPETGEEVITNVGDPYFVQNSPDYAIDLVGIIYKPTGNILTDAESMEYPEMASLDGYHINIRLNGDKRREDVETLSKYFVDPTTPSRVWS